MWEKKTVFIIVCPGGEQVQRRTARYVTNRYHNTSSVLAMLNHLQLPTLEHRRNLKQNYNAL
jgi:hypothetical protein